MIEETKYKMRIIITDLNSKNRMANDIVVKLRASFEPAPKRFGDGYCVTIGDGGSFYRFIDLCCDSGFDPKNKASYLEKWAREQWNGKDSAYCVKSLKITPIE